MSKAKSEPGQSIARRLFAREDRAGSVGVKRSLHRRFGAEASSSESSDDYEPGPEYYLGLLQSFQTCVSKHFDLIKIKT